MRTPAGQRRRLAAAVCCALCVCAAAAAEPPDGYRDRLIDNGQLAPLPPEDGDGASESTSGLPRSWHVETGYGRTERGERSVPEAGMALSGFWETPNWGVWSVEASGRRSAGNAYDRGSGASLTVWQRQMPIDGEWVADNGVGVLNSPLLPLARRQYRFALPTTPTLGVSTDWRRPGLELQGSWGQPGVLDGGRWSSFEPLGGHVASVGMQTTLAAPWQAAVAFLDAEQSRTGISRTAEWSPLTDARGRSAYAAVAWQGARTEVQANLLASRYRTADAPEADAEGLWIDATTQAGRATHRYGLFRLDSDLVWGIVPFSSGIQGGYYRVDRRSARWTWNAGVDDVRSLDRANDGRFVSGSVRYQASARWGVGASGTVRTGDGTAQTIQAYADRRGTWGTTRLQADAVRDPIGRNGQQLTLDHAFPFSGSTHLSAAVSLAQINGVDAGTTRTRSLSIYGGRNLGALSLDGNVRLTRGDGPEAERGFDGNVGLNWRVNPRWSLAATFYRSQGERRSPFVLDPLAGSVPFVPKPRDQAWFLTLRHDMQAGSPAAVLGGTAGSGSGRLEGSVYLDDNADGIRNANERTAEGLTVILDGRFSVRTDETGRFVFPAVGAGTHRIAVLSDNLPLPWRFAEGDAVRVVRIEPRAIVRVDVGAQRN